MWKHIRMYSIFREWLFLQRIACASINSLFFKKIFIWLFVILFWYNNSINKLKLSNLYVAHIAGYFFPQPKNKIKCSIRSQSDIRPIVTCLNDSFFWMNQLSEWFKGSHLFHSLYSSTIIINTNLIKEIVHPGMKIIFKCTHLQAIQVVD